MVVNMQCQLRTKLYHMVIVRLCMQHHDEQIMYMIQHFLSVCMSASLNTYYRPQGKIMFLHLSVILIHGGRETPLCTETPSDIWWQPLQWSVRTLLECILVLRYHFQNHKLQKRKRWGYASQSQFPLQSFRNIIVRSFPLARIPSISNTHRRLVLYVLTA